MTLKDKYTTEDMPRPPRGKTQRKPPRQPTEDSARRRKAVEARLAEIPGERAKHKESLLECTELRRKLEKSLARTEKRAHR